MRVSAATDCGRVRSQNQDAYCYEQLPGGAFLAVVCDGMGGARAGEIASRTATREIRDYVLRSYSQQMNPSGIEAMLKAAVESANTAVYNDSRQEETHRGMGTTVVLALIQSSQGFLLHAGDSRAYLYRDPSLLCLTRDHSMVQHLLDTGKITRDEAAQHPQRNIITRALGVAPTLNAEADFFELRGQERLLLCTDGLFNMLSAQEMAEELSVADEQTAQRLIERANAAGGTDNITAVIVSNE